MNNKNIKLIFELIFIFILPLVFICFTSEIQIERNFQYDNNGNYETSADTKKLSFDNSIIKYIGNQGQYKNYIDFNQLRNTNQGEFNNTVSNYGVIAREYTPIIVGHIYFVSLDIEVSNTPSLLSFKLGNSGYAQFYVNCNTTGHYEKRGIIEEISATTEQASMFQVGGSGGTVNISYYNVQIFDLTKMFGSGFEPSIEDFKSYINTNIVYDYIESKEEIIYNDNIISNNSKINYTIWGNIKELLINNLDLNDNVLLDIVLCYTILWFIMFLIWHLLYGFLELLFHVIPSRWKEGNLR